VLKEPQVIAVGDSFTANGTVPGSSVIGGLSNGLYLVYLLDDSTDAYRLREEVKERAEAMSISPGELAERMLDIACQLPQVTVRVSLGYLELLHKTMVPQPKRGKSA